MSVISFFVEAAFDPETVEVLASAFDTAWQRVEKSGSALALGEDAATTRETLAKRIIAAARAGERDKNRLVEQALSSVAPPSGARQSPSKAST